MFRPIKEISNKNEDKKIILNNPNKINENTDANKNIDEIQNLKIKIYIQKKN